MINFHENCLGAWPQFTGSRIKVKESYAVQASERAAAQLARRRRQMETGRIMGGRIQGEAVKVKCLPVAGNVTIGDNFIKPPPGSARCAFGEPLNRKKLHMGYFK